MSRGVNQVKDVLLSLISVFHLDGVALDGDASFTLQVHIVKHLSLRNLDGVRVLKQAVGQCRFAVVDMGNDAEIADIFHSSFTYDTIWVQKYKKNRNQPLVETIFIVLLPCKTNQKFLFVPER